MEIENNSLKVLAKILEKQTTLYAVGGCVRNALLCLPYTDIDVCSDLSPDKLEEIIDRTKYKFELVNETLGTALIMDGNNRFEHTTFRTESYGKKGEHTPQKTQFTNEIIKDCLRRDFTVNSLYYNLLNGEIIDLCGGQKDIRKKIIRCVNSPKLVFHDDGLRLLRLIRFAGELNFKIEAKTLKAAKNNLANLCEISKERIQTEFIKILNCKEKYYKEQNNPPRKEILLMKKLGYFDYIFDNYDKKALKFKYLFNFYGKYDALALFMLDFYFASKFKNVDTFIQHTCLDALKLSKKTSSEIARLITAVIGAEKFDDEYLLKFQDIIPQIIPFLDKNVAQHLQFVYSDRQKKNAPTSLSELDINSYDLMQLGVETKQINNILHQTLLYAFACPEFNDKEKLIKFVKETLKI